MDIEKAAVEIREQQERFKEMTRTVEQVRNEKHDLMR